MNRNRSRVVRIGKRFRGVRRLTAVVLAIGILAVPAPAGAHAAFTRSSSVPADSDQSLALDVPEEKGTDVHNSKIVVEVPGAFTVSGCDQRPEWSCATSAASGTTLVTWTRTSGSDPGAPFSFGVHTPKQHGGYPFDVNQSYTDGSTVHWDGPPDSDTPAPILQVG